MKNNNANIYFPNKNEWKGFSITDNAIKQILFLINSHTDNKGIRLGIKKSGCAGFRYTMELIKKSELKQEKIKKKKHLLIKIFSSVFLLKEMPFLEGIKIDFIKNHINRVFKFYNPKLEKFCGCGESFSID